MAYSSLPTVNPGDFGRASWANLVDTNLDDHEARIVDLETSVGGGAGTGDVTGPASATDNAIARYDGATGKLIQTSGITISDGAAGTLSGTNTGDISLITTAANYLSIAAQVVTLGLINLASHVTGRLPFANLTAATQAARLLLRGSASGGGDWQEGTIGAGLAIVGTELRATAAAPALDDVTDVALSTLAAGQVLTWNGANWVNQTPTTPSPASGANYLVSGGQVAWTSAYTFNVAAATYVIGGVTYSSPASTVTLSAADATLDRIDVIAVNTSGAVVAVEGTPAAQPSEPDVDPSTQLQLAFVPVAAASSAASVTSTTLYADNVGGPGEWNWTTSGSGFNVNSSTNPRTGTKDIEGTTVANAAYAQAQIASGTIEPASYDRIVLYIRSKGTWNAGRILRVQWFSTGVAKGSALTIASGYWGFDSSNTTDYQLVSIPMSQFAIAAGVTVNQLRITDVGGSIGFYIDDVALQAGGTSDTTVVGMTQTQADARYRLQSVPISLTADVSGDLPLANLAPMAAGSTLLGRGDSGAGDAQAITLGTGLAMTGTTLSASGSAGAPSNAQYVTLATDATLSAERVLTGTANQITITDGGANGAVTLSTPQNLHTGATPQFARMGLGNAADATAVLKMTGHYASVTVADGNSSTALTLNWNDGNTRLVTLTGNCTFTFSNPIDGGRYLIALKQDGTGSRTATWPANVKWSAGTAPTLSTAAGKCDVVTLVYVAGLGASGNYLAAANTDYTPA